MESTVPEKAVGPLSPGDPGTEMPEWELPPVPVEEKRKSHLSVLGIPSAAELSTSVKPKAWKLPMPAVFTTTRAKSNRRRCLITSVVVALAVLALIIGLAVGLTRKSSKSQNLPLPGGAATYTGDLTYYGVGLGACGLTSTPDQNIVAVSHTIFDAAQTGSDPNANPLCGQKIRAKRYYAEVGAERSVDLTVVDRCVGCKPTDLDVSTGAFDQLAAEASGRVDVTWAWLTPAATGS